MSALDDLRAARALIADPKRWTQGVNARDAEDRQVDANARSATCWCALGALLKTSPTFAMPGHRFLADAISELFGRDLAIAHVNDELGHVAVLCAYDRAIELAEAQS